MNRPPERGIAAVVRWLAFNSERTRLQDLYRTGGTASIAVEDANGLTRVITVTAPRNDTIERDIVGEAYRSTRRDWGKRP